MRGRIVLQFRPLRVIARSAAKLTRTVNRMFKYVMTISPTDHPIFPGRSDDLSASLHKGTLRYNDLEWPSRNIETPFGRDFLLSTAYQF